MTFLATGVMVASQALKHKEVTWYGRVSGEDLVTWPPY